MISGGYGPDGHVVQIVDVRTKSGKKECQHEDTNFLQVHHSTDNLISCGGMATKDNCRTLSNGKWVQTQNLTYPRWGHSSWATEDSVIIMGGYEEGSSNTTEIVSKDSALTTDGFNLKYETRFVVV